MRALTIFVVPLVTAGLSDVSLAQERPARWLLTIERKIGSIADEGYELTPIADLVVGEDQSVYIAQPMDQQVVVFDSSGHFLRRIGRAGTGPGEFCRPLQLGLVGGRLWVWDAGANRISWFINRRRADCDAKPATRRTDLGPHRRKAGRVLVRHNGRGTARVACRSGR